MLRISNAIWSSSLSSSLGEIFFLIFLTGGKRYQKSLSIILPWSLNSRTIPLGRFCQKRRGPTVVLHVPARRGLPFARLQRVPSIRPARNDGTVGSIKKKLGCCNSEGLVTCGRQSHNERQVFFFLFFFPSLPSAIVKRGDHLWKLCKPSLPIVQEAKEIKEHRLLPCSTHLKTKCKRIEP